MVVEQLLLFEIPRTETERISDELKELKNNVDKQRRGLFARLSDTAADVTNLQNEMAIFTMQLYTLEAYVRQKVEEIKKINEIVTKERKENDDEAKS